MSLDARADELDKKLEANPIDTAIETLVKDAKRHTRRVRILTISVILEVILIVGLGFVSLKTAEVARLASDNKNAVIANCETANDSRKNQRALWNYILEIPPNEPPTTTQENRNNDFRDFVATTFAPRDCQAEAN